MPTIGSLKAQLIAKGYAMVASPSLPIACFTHPLITAPVVIVGLDGDTAKPYQEEAVNAAIKKR